MFRKILLVISVLVVGGFLYFGFSKFKELKKPASDIYTAIPVSSVVVIDVMNPKKQWNDLISNNIIWDELQEFESIKALSMQIMDLDSSISSLTKKKLEVSNHNTIISIITNKESDLTAIVQLDAPKHIKPTDLIQQFGKILNGKIIDNKTGLYEIQTEKKSIYVLLTQGILSFSYSQKALNDISAQLISGEDLLHKESFNIVKKTSSKNADIKLFIHPQRLSQIISPIFNEKTTNWLSLFPAVGSWTELDVSIKPNELSCNGFITSADSTREWISIFKGQEGVKPKIIEYLPNRTAFFTHFGFSDFSLLKSNFREQKLNSGIDYNQQVFKWDTTYGISIEDNFISWIDDEIAIVISEPEQPNFDDNKMVWISTTDSRNVFQHLSNMSVQIANKKNISLYSIPFRGHQITKLDIPDFLPYSIGLDINSVTENYFTQIEDYIVFANSPSILQWTITRVENEKTLANDPHFQTFTNKTSNTSNIFIYTHIAGSPLIYQSLTNNALQKEIELYSEWLQKFQASSVQLSYENNDLYYVNSFTKYNPVYKKESNSLWELPLDTVSEFKPIIVTNHYTMASEIFTQDLANNLYLINNKGKILWKRKINEKIESKPQQIDVYNNGKFQIVFNTRHQIYIIDRNGNDLAHFPISLDTEASGQLSVIDYEKNKNYRLLIPLLNGEIRNYTTEGVPVRGWSYQKNNHYLIQSISHISIKNKDYLLSVYDDGSLSILNRRGEHRLKLSSKFNFQPLGKVQIQQGSSLQNSYIMAVTENNEVVKISLSDKKTRLFNLNMGIVNQVDFRDVDFDGSVEIVASDSNSFNIYRTDGKKLVSDTTSINPNYPINFYRFDERNWIGYNINNQIFLSDFNGNIHSGFPLKGSVPITMSDINHDGRLNIITIDEKGIMYTYTLER